MDKVIDIEERIPSMREKRRRKTNKKFLFIIVVFCAALLVLLYFQSPLSKVGEIVIHGAELHDDQFYFEKSGILVGNSYWGFDTEEVENELLKIKGVSNVSVKRKWLRDVDISVSEWKTVAYVEEKGQFVLLLENSDIISSNINYPNVPILNNMDDLKVRKKLTSQLLKMSDDVRSLISEIIYTGTKNDPDTITVYMDDGYEVHAIIQTFAEKMDYYPEITSQLGDVEKGIIDMEVGTFFSPYSEVYGNEGEDDVDGEENE